MLLELKARYLRGFFLSLQ
ncbi:hypothetical protein CP8484711_1865, partial [Chlamydia psittaci 84-8471/1]